MMSDNLKINDFSIFLKSHACRKENVDKIKKTYYN